MTTLEIAELDHAHRAVACDALPLHRLAQGTGSYLVAWLDEVPVGHVYLARTSPPELQDLFVADGHRRAGIGTALIAAAEDACVRASCSEVALAVSLGSAATRAMYESLGYRDVGIEPRRVTGSVEVRTGRIEVDDTLLTLVKDLRAP